MAACLLVSCSTQEALDRKTEPDRTLSGAPTPPGEAAGRRSPAQQPTPDEILGALPTVPSAGLRSAPALAGQLDRAAATVRDRDATAVDVRRAAEFHQLAVRTLTTASDTFRRRVMTRLHPETALVTRGDVRAGRSLHAMTTPQQTLPRWRIVEPPPAAELIRYYREAQRRTGVPWAYLAAIHLVETRMGRIRGTSTAGALGPMQFLPTTWALYGAGGDINDPRDAILAAARLLRANGAPGKMAQALWHYNPSDNYVRAVSEQARTIQRARSAYRGYWHWHVLYSHVRGTYLLPVGYPDKRAVLLRQLVGNGGRR
jgi:membrane-bound lytic murein transglycosylase B